uniref:Putative conserved secreted protein n=1 Tax=Ornithodoros turicata TaxID=34597 RepID=A0A2R5LEF9_9ACAR
MKILLCLTIFICSGHGEIEGMKKACREKQQPANDPGCMYYCDDTYETYGTYPDMTGCDYTGTRDGKCKDGLCYPGPKSKAPVGEP